MFNVRKKRFTLLVAILALAAFAAGCSGASDDETSVAVEAEMADVPDGIVEETPSADSSVESEQPETGVEPDDGAVADDADEEASEPETVEPLALEAETSGFDTSSFESLALPDYVTDVLTGDYVSYLVEVEPGINVHVLEVGSGYPVYLQHGAPTSGLLYRKVADQLSADQFRLIMPTMVGLGFSSKVPAELHTLDNHIRWMNEVLTQLDLEELIYVGHDWGGPVGMGALAGSPELLRGAVVLNTAFGAPSGPVEFNPALAALLAPLPPEQEVAVAGLIFDQLAGAQNDPASLAGKVSDLYRRPVVESGNPIGSLAILRMAADGPDHPTAAPLRAIDEYIAQIEVPTEIVWGMNDPALGARLDEMIENFPNAGVTRTDEGHFLQEEGEGPEQIARAVQRVFEAAQAG